MTDDERKRLQSAIRSKRRRRLRKGGLRVFKVALNPDALAERLINAGQIEATAELDYEKLGYELQEILDDWLG